MSGEKRYPLPINLFQNEIKNALFHNLSTPPSNPKIGQYYYDTDDALPYFWNGLTWEGFGAAGVESVTSTDNHIVVDNTDPSNPTLSFQLVDNENLLTDDELAIVQATSGTNTGDQDLSGYILSDTTLQTAGTLADDSLFSWWNGTARVKNTLLEIKNYFNSWFPNHLPWLTSGHTGTANTIAGFDGTGVAKEYKATIQSAISTSSGTIDLGINTITVLTTTLTNSHTITVTPTAPTEFINSQIAQLDFTTGVTTPSITLTAPIGVTLKWRHTEITAWTASKTYTIQFVWISSTRCDIYYLIS